MSPNSLFYLALAEQKAFPTLEPCLLAGDSDCAAARSTQKLAASPAARRLRRRAAGLPPPRAWFPASVHVPGQQDASIVQMLAQARGAASLHVLIRLLAGVAARFPAVDLPLHRVIARARAQMCAGPVRISRACGSSTMALIPCQA